MKRQAQTMNSGIKIWGIGLLTVALSGIGWAAISDIKSPLSKQHTGGVTHAWSSKLQRNKTLASPALAQSFGKLPLSFEENQGQVDGKVKYLARGQGYTLFLTETEAVLALRSAASEKLEGKSKKLVVRSEEQEKDREASGVKREAEGEGAKAALQGGGTVDAISSIPPSSESSSPQAVGGDPSEPAKMDSRLKMSGMTDSVILMKFAGANQTTTVKGDDKLPGIVNYFIGNDPEKWRTKIPAYKKVQYDNLYEGIDLVYYGNQGQLEYDLVVSLAPHRDQIQGDEGYFDERQQKQKFIQGGRYEWRRQNK